MEHPPRLENAVAQLVKQFSADLKPVSPVSNKALDYLDAANVDRNIFGWYIQALVKSGAAIHELEVSKKCDAEGNVDHILSYARGLSEDQTSVEFIHCETPSKIMTLTYGIPEKVGVMEVYDVQLEAALSELMTSSIGHMGEKEVSVNPDAPEPKQFGGLYQFSSQRIEEYLPAALDTLFGQ